MSELSFVEPDEKAHPGGDAGGRSKTGARRSKRQPKPIRHSSQTEDDEDNFPGGRKRPRKNPPKRIPRIPTRRVVGPVDSEGNPFCCDKCQSPYVIDPKKSSKTDSKKVPGPRYKVDPETGRRLKLCNACGLAFDRAQRKPQRPKPKPATDEDRNKYAEDAEKFANSLVEGLSDPDAARLACPHFGQKPCGCIQRYVIGEGNMEDSRTKANGLLMILKQAKKLKDKKCYNVDEVISRGKKHRKVGLGNGQKKSKEFEEFVLTNRKYLRDEVKLCERATQRILMYSNNFLHKKLKTEPERTRRIERSRGQAALGLLKGIADLPDEKCCEDRCSLLAKTHSTLLTQWRKRAVSGQAEARKVLAEMLTPSGLRSNCYKFINLVTGCSLSTITRVSEQMKATGGDREPPPHGLCKYWEDNPRRQRKLPSNEIPTYRATPHPVSLVRSTASPPTTMTPAQLKEQQLQLKRLQQQLEEQQRQVQQRQQLIENQLLEHKLATEKKNEKLQQQQQQQQLLQQQLRLQEQQNQHLQQQVLQQTQLHQQQDEEEEDTTEQEEQLEEEQVADTQQVAAVTQSIPVPISLANAAGLSAAGVLPGLPANLEGLNPQILQQNMQHLLTEIASQITQQQQNMQQLLNELTAQQIQQLTNAAAVATANPTAVANVTGAITSQPPPSYPVAVALNAVNAGQQVQTTSTATPVVNVNTSIPVTSNNQPHVIIQAIPALQQNVLLGNATLTSQLLNTSPSDTHEQQESPTGTVQLNNQPYSQQILVSLPPSLNQDTLTASTLAPNELTPDALNSTEIVEIQFQEASAAPPNQEVPQDLDSQDLTGTRQSTNELQDAINQQIRLAGLHFGNQELRAALGVLPQSQTSTRNRSSRFVDPAVDITSDSTRQAISLLQQASDAGTSAGTSSALLPADTLLSPDALNLVLQPMLSSTTTK